MVMMALSLAILSPPLFQPLSQTVQSLPPQVVFSEGFVRAMLYHPFQEARYATYSPSHPGYYKVVFNTTYYGA